MKSIASRLGKTPQQVFFKFVSSLGIMFLTGTKSQDHMVDDLTCFDVELTAEDKTVISNLLL